MVLYITANEQKGTYCIIGIYASRKSGGNLDKDFEEDWKRIVLPL